jgi:ferredoxin
MNMKPLVSIDRELCVGHGRCYTLEPRVFASDDMGRGEVRDTVDVDPSTLDLARVVDACPEEAISLTTSHLES